MIRKFKLRNGIIVQEMQKDDNTVINAAGYQDDYIILYTSNDKYIVDQRVCLSVINNDLPTGGCLGDGFDIVEEFNY